MQPKLIFVVGASRSGTTLMSKILGRHSLLYGTAELHFFGDLCGHGELGATVTEHEGKQILATLLARQERDIWGRPAGKEEFAEAEAMIRERDHWTKADLLRSALNHIATKHGKSIAVEQTPRNIFFANEILDKLENSFVIEMVRDPRAVLFSQRDRWKMKSLGAGNVPFWESVRVKANYHAVTLTKMWKAALEAGDLLIEHPRFVRVRYEDLAQRPEETVHHLCDRLNLLFERSMLDVSRLASSTLRNDSNATGVSSASVEAWRGKLPSGEQAICERIARTNICALDYSLDVAVQSGAKRGELIHLLKWPIHAVAVMVTNPRRALTLLRSMTRKLS